MSARRGLVPSPHAQVTCICNGQEKSHKRIVLGRQKEPRLCLARVDDLRLSSTLNALVLTAVAALSLSSPCLPHRTQTSASINAPIGDRRTHDSYPEPQIQGAVTSPTGL